MRFLRKILHSLNPVGSFSKPARLFLLAVIVDGVIYSAWQLFYNFFILSRGFDRNYLGLVNAAPSIAGMLLGIPLGLLSDRLGRRKAMLLGLVASTLGMGIQLLVLDPGVIFFMALVAGAGNMLYIVSQAPFMMKTSTPENRALLFSLQYGLSTLAGSVGNLFAGQLPDLFQRLLGIAPNSTGSYQAVLMVAVVMGSLSLLPIGLLREPADPEPAKPDQPRESIRAIIARPRVIQLYLPNFVIGFGAAILIPYLNVFFAERHSLSDQSLGALFSLSALLTGVGCLIGPSLARLLKSKIKTVVITQSLSLGFLLAIGFSPAIWLAELGFLMRATLMNMAQPLYTAFAME
ncbi:MAG TPA: MFS transporter, partial [Anaerolineaceae bacterium]|nr:MFS transporter [Anaerolineaceae bacterium]